MPDRAGPESGFRRTRTNLAEKGGKEKEKELVDLNISVIIAGGRQVGGGGRGRGGINGGGKNK